MLVNEELKDIHLSRIRAVCAQQSKSQWTSIATRDRLYQFIALSDAETQRVMREKVSSLTDLEKGGESSNTPISSSTFLTSFDTWTAQNERRVEGVPVSRARGTKR
jgi:hypothetical protein